MTLRFLLLGFFILGIQFMADLQATHNRAGDITYVQIDELTVACTITTYTKRSSVNADRDSLVINWGDGSTSIVLRTNGGGNGVNLGNDIKKNIYEGVHTYPGRGTYTISVQDPNRIAEIKNIPNSVNVRFFLFARLTLLNSQFQGGNNGVQLLEPPIDVGCVGQPFVHNPNAYDKDGDSLSFELVEPFQAKDSIVDGYVLPSGVLPGPANQVFLDPKTGEFSWFFPPQSGDYNIAIQINEYREGVLINSMIRDMQIQIFECDNRPPVVTAPNEICVIAGDTVEFEVVANDPESAVNRIRLTASGGTFELNISPSTFEGDSSFYPGPVVRKFQWITRCEHIRNEAYSVVFKAEDSPQRPPPLTDLHTVLIKVVGPPPEDFQGSVQGEVVRLDWEQPYLCEAAADDYFYGFSVWRQRRSIPIPPDTCLPGLEGRGYELINFRSRDIDNGRYFFIDSTASRGITYCYRIQAEFARYSRGGNPFNFVPSLPSAEICIQLSRDQPLITHVDVLRTQENNGAIRVEWLRPLPEDLDTLARPGPYIYRVERSITGQGIYTAIPGAQFIAPRWSSPVDSHFVDSLIDTRSTSYTYRVQFTYGNLPAFRTSEPASSILASAGGTDKAVILTWEEFVPWSNLNYLILRENLNGGEDTLGQVSNPPFEDRDLTNGLTYCYRILSEGTYAIDGTPEILLNHSQRVCATPVDTVGPCSPEITATNDCETSDDEPLSFVNLITWNDITSTCPNSQDVAQIIILFRSNDSSNWIPLDTLAFGSGFAFEHQPQGTSSGCYSVIAIDTAGNPSRLSNVVCLENCPLYELPNVFTPDQNGQNDVFKPRINRFVERVEFRVYNRWGNLLFETDDPEINWDGRNLAGEEIPTGTYFYSCVVFEKLFDGIQPLDRVLSGYVELRR